MFIHRVAIFLFALALPAHAATLFVSPDGTGADGMTWPTAFPSIGEAIVASSTGDEIWIKSATYVENLVIQKPLTLLGGFAGTEALEHRSLRDPDSNETIVDGNRNGSSVFTIASTSASIEGLTAQNGIASEGSGLRIDNATATLDNLNILNNGGPSGARSGGGIRIRNSTCEIHDCHFFHNRAEYGGGISIAYSTLRILSSVFQENRSNDGGGITISSGAHVEIGFCTFAENDAVRVIIRIGSSIPIVYGGEGSAIALSSGNRDTTLTTHDSVFSLNTLSNGGSGSAFFGRGDFSAHFENCTCIVGAHTLGFGVFRFSSLPVLRNCIVVDEPGGNSQPIGEDSASVSYSLIEGGYPGEGNIDTDPQFVDIEGGDYHLQRGSPCIDSGTDTGLTIDFEGSPRPIGDYDMGAFEFPVLRSDFDGNRVVDKIDLIIFSQDWGKVSVP